MMKKEKNVFITVALFVLLACRSSAPVTANELPGSYVVQTGKVTDTLSLRTDGEFQHHLLGRDWVGNF